MIVLQSVSHNNSERFQRQIAVGETKIARVMGPRVIRDVAIIGFDPYMRDGAAMGILFHANNGMLLGNNLNDQRQEAMAEAEGATEKTVRIADRDVSYMESPDGRLRSYYVVDGDYHLVCSSRRLVERFLETGAGGGSLGASDEFQIAREAMPLLARRHDLFVPIGRVLRKPRRPALPSGTGPPLALNRRNAFVAVGAACRSGRG